MRTGIGKIERFNCLNPQIVNYSEFYGGAPLSTEGGEGPGVRV